MLTGTKIGIREIPDDPENRSLNIVRGHGERGPDATPSWLTAARDIVVATCR